MGGKKKADKDKKKKGPKGKKARAKAKLDRQWGETTIVDDGKKTKRIGKSRLLTEKTTKSTITWGGEEIQPAAKKKRKTTAVNIGILKEPTNSNNEKSVSKKKTRRFQQRYDSDSDDDDDNDSASVNSNESEENDLADLLKTIKKATKKKKRKNQRIEDDENEMAGASNDRKMEESSDDDDSDMEEDEEDFEEFQDVASDENDDDDDDEELDDMDSIQGDIDNSNKKLFDNEAQDLFRQRFDRDEKLEESDFAHNNTHILALQEDLKLHIMHRQGSNTLNALISEKEDDANSNKKKGHDWQRMAETAFAGNRVILQRQWQRLHKQIFTDDQAPLYPFMARYTDMLVTTESLKLRSEMHRIYMLHVLNHVLTSRGRIQRHNKKLKDIEDQEKKNENDDDDDGDDSKNNNDDDDDEDDNKFRDQGYTRPTVLVLLPTRSTANKFVHHMLRMLKTEVQQPHMERFEAEYGKVDADEEEAPLGEEQERRRKMILKKKGKEWNELFGDEVNQDDDFKLGISITPKAASTGKKDKKKKSSNVAVKLYSDFYKSDIIVASPLGLKVLIQKTNDEDSEEDGDHDYLSSIEICLMQYADVMLMQNWDHVNYVLNLLNKQPEKNNNTDFSRVRNYCLDGQAAHWRQLIISTKVVDPFILNSFKRFGKSESGSIKMRREVTPDLAALSRVLVPMRQVFQQISAPSPKDQGDARVKFFVKNILPQILQDKQKHTMIYIPSYFDFVAVRNIMMKRELRCFVNVTEYSRITEVSRGRARFLQGRKSIMLFTGRCNYFHRHAIKGIRHLIFLGLPEHPEFYSDQVNLINTTVDDEDPEAPAPSCLVLFTRYEAHALERIVATGNCSRMLQSEKNTFMFYS